MIFETGLTLFTYLSCNVSHFRVGDVLLSVSDTPLEGVAIEAIQDMIKNCPRGDVRVVAQAGPKPPKRTETVEETAVQEANISQVSELSSSDVTKLGELKEVSPSKIKMEGKRPPDVLSNSTFHLARVDLPDELVSQENSGIVNKTHKDLMTSKRLQGADETLRPATPPQQRHPDEVITSEDSELELADFNDLPPLIPPPPVPVNDWQLESSSVSVDEPVGQDSAQEISLDPPSVFDDFSDGDETDLSPVVCDSEMDDTKISSARAPTVTPLDSKPDNPSNLQMKEESLNLAELSSRFPPKPIMSPEDTQPLLPIKPPSLFGDDTESISASSPPKPTLDMFDEDVPSWNGIQTTSIKPPSLFDDELESLPSLPLAPLPPTLEKQFIVNHGLDTNSSNSSSPLQSPWVKRKSSKDTTKIRHSDVTVTSGSEPRSSSPSSHGNVFSLDVVDPFSDVPIEPQDVVDDDMSSLPPAPPPPRSAVNRSSSWSVRPSDAKTALPHGHQQVPYISSPLPTPAKPERKNSKKRILPLRIRSKKGRKTSEQTDASLQSDPHRESLAQSGQMGFDDHPQSPAHIEPPEDDMESLPPAPPPPRMSPLTVESLENMVDGFRPMKVPQSQSHPSQLTSEERRAIVSTVGETSHPSHSPKKKKISFRRNVIHMDVNESFSESSQSVPLESETYTVVDTSLKQLSPPEDESAVTDSSDAMSPPPLPPEMELWSEGGSAEAELALLDQILNLEDSPRSGNEHSSEGGGSSSSKCATYSKDTLEGTSTEVKDAPTVSKFEETSDQSEPFEGSLESGSVTLSLQASPDIKAGIQPEFPTVDSQSQIQAKTKEDSESSPGVADFEVSTTSEVAHQGLSGRLLKQPSEEHDSGNVVKHRRPAPPIPTRPQVKTGSISRKPLPAGLGIAVLPSRPDIKPKAASPSHHPPPKHQKEQKVSSPVKEKKKLFSKSHRSKQKQTDSDHLESPDTSFESSPDGRERSRSWTKKLFGFRSRSKSRDKTRERDERGRRADRSRSASPPRGLFSKSRRSSPPPPPPSSKKAPVIQLKKDIEQKEPVREERAHYMPVEENHNMPLHPPTVPSSVDLNNPPYEERPFVEGYNNKSVPPVEDDFISAMGSSVVNAERHTYDEVSTLEDDFDPEEAKGENDRLAQEMNDLSDSEQLLKTLSVESDVTDVHSDVDTSRTKRPLPALPTRTDKPNNATTLTDGINDKQQGADEQKVPKKPKPPVLKKPQFLKSRSTPNSQQQRTVDELKLKFNKASSCDERLETAPDNVEKLRLNLQDQIAQDTLNDQEDLPSPGPPTFKPVPPPLALQSVSQGQMDENGTAVCPNSPGPPRFKPLPPPLDLKAVGVQNEVINDGTTGVLDSLGPPRFKPAPPPLLLQNGNSDYEQEDRPSFPDQPHFKPLPPLPVAATTTQRPKEDVTVNQNVGKDVPVGNGDVQEVQNGEQRKMKPLPPLPVSATMTKRIEEDLTVKQKVGKDVPGKHDSVEEVQNVEQGKMKPLPPIPSGFNLTTDDNRDIPYSVDHDDNYSNHKLPRSRQDAQEDDNIEDDDILEILEHQPEWSPAELSYTEDNLYSQVSKDAEPPIVQSAVVPVDASHGDGFESSDLSSEWDDTCSSTQEDPGLSVPGARFARSASFSVGDVQIKQPPPAVEQKRQAPITLKRPPPPMRRRSSSLPHVFAETEASQGRSGKTDYWHSGNLQELINSRNQEPDVDEGVIEVQVSYTKRKHTTGKYCSVLSRL